MYYNSIDRIVDEVIEFTKERFEDKYVDFFITNDDVMIMDFEGVTIIIELPRYDYDKGEFKNGMKLSTTNRFHPECDEENHKSVNSSMAVRTYITKHVK